MKPKLKHFIHGGTFAGYIKVACDDVPFMHYQGDTIWLHSEAHAKQLHEWLTKYLKWRKRGKK